MNRNKFAMEGMTIYFSKDRPMQLDLALRTSQHFSVDWDYQREVVIYKATDKRFENAYAQLALEHPHKTLIEQTDFKEDVLNFLKDFQYIMFVVDDCIFTGEYSLVEICTKLEEHPEALGFSLRLGENTKMCYPHNIINTFPAMRKIKKSKVRIFNWANGGMGDFSYPLEVSSSVYRVNDLKNLLNNGSYNEPNSLEHFMYSNLNLFLKSPYLLSYQTSVAFCNPVNKVQTVNNNRTGTNSEYSVENLLKKYEEGYRIDDTKFYGFVSNGCHEERELEFIKNEI